MTRLSSTRRPTEEGPGGEKWVIEESLDGLVELISGLLTDDPLFVLLNSYTTGLSPSACGYILNNRLTRRFGGFTTSDELGLPVEDSGFIMPCGAASRWVKKFLSRPAAECV